MKTPESIDSHSSIIDSREVEARIDWLEDMLTDAEYKESNPDEVEELQALLDFRDEVGSSEWQHGMSLINEGYFDDYARELAEDIHGAAIRNAEWPFSCIDWEQAAHDLRMDYSSAEYDDTTFYYRG